MAFQRFQKVNSDDRVLNQVQDNIERSLAPIIRNTALDFQIVEGVLLVNGLLNKIPHGLGRPLMGWTTVRLRGQAIVWDDQDLNTGASHLYLYLRTTAVVTVDLKVF